MAQKVVHQAKVQAIREFRATLANPGKAFPIVPIAEFGGVNIQPLCLQAAPLPEPIYPPANVDGIWMTMTPTEAVNRYIRHNPKTGGSNAKARKGGASWTDKTREQFKLPALLLEQVMKGRPLATVTHDDLVELHECFMRLHGPSFRKSEHQRRMTILEIADQTDQLVRKGEISPDDIGLGIGTTNRHWGFLKQLTEWFSSHQPIAKLNYGAFIENDSRDPRSLRDAYSVEEGEAVFKLAPWQGSKSHTRRIDEGLYVVHDALYFVPLIAWYTGLRRDEICGMEIADVKIENDLWHFAVRDNATRKLKTTSTVRLMPLAEELLRLGLLDYVNALRDEGEIHLFPELRAESGKGTMGDAFYKKWWIKLAAHLPFIERGQALHSFRHTMTDELKAKSVSVEIRADLAGHKLEGETDGRYSKASRLEVLREAVDKVPVVTKSLKPRPISLLPKRIRAGRKARPSRTCAPE